MPSKNYFIELIEYIKKNKPAKEKLSSHKNKLCSKYKIKTPPTNIQVLLNAEKEDISKIKKYLLTKPTRTLSGVAVVSIMTKPLPCPHVRKGTGPCSYCPGGIDSVFGTVPQSYTGREPATMRAIRNHYDSYLQVFNRLEQYTVTGHSPEKIELIIMGGTFPSFPKQYREEFIKYAFKAMNDFSKIFYKGGELDIVKFKEFFELPGDVKDKKREKRIQNNSLKLKGTCNLKNEQKKNENSKIKCVGLTIETRPDFAKLEHANEMLRLGCTRVELGVQTVYEEILKKIGRGHTVKDSINATRTLKDLGFKINYHMMPGLPGVGYREDLNSLKEIFKNPDFKPDMLKIYPCMVLKGTKLYDEWKKGKYKPLTTKKAAELIAKFKKYVPKYVRIMRVQRDIPTLMTEAGVDRTNLRQYIKDIMNKKGVRCNCIRCREIGHVLNKNKKIRIGKIKILTKGYEASQGIEFFMSAEDVKNDVLFGFCRLRFPNQFLRSEITKDSALIREIHICSPAVAIGKKSKTSYQHRGLGKKLLEKAEQIARTYYKKKIVVISGIGARGYFAKLGYKLQGPYMIKFIN